MTKSFIHFNRRDIRLRFPSDPANPWFSEFQDESDGFERPKYHVTRAINGPAADVKPGDIIWLVGQLYAPWGEHLPATFDARIDVASLTKREKGRGFRYAASGSSRWFPLTNATGELRRLMTPAPTQQNARLWKDHSRAVGQYLRRLRELASDRPLRSWESQLSERPLHFVSYRIQDGSKAAFECVRQLINQGVRVFWDRWSLPRRLAERREAVGDCPLDATIDRNIRRADVVWGIETPLYKVPGSYAARERELAKSLNKYRAFGSG